MPDGKGLIFRRRLAGQSANEFDIMAMSIPGGTPRPLLHGVYAHYAGAGPLLVVTGDGKLLAVPFDPKKMVLMGAPVAVMDGLLRNGPFEVNLAVSPTGTLVYTAGGSAGTNSAWWVNRDGSSTPVDTTWRIQGSLTSISLSPDGKSLAVTVLRGAAQTSGSSSSRRDRSRDSPSAIPRIFGARGPATVDPWSTSTTSAAARAIPS
jgi:hypothetical protein